MVESLLVETILGDLRPGATTFGDQLPQFFGTGGISWEATAHADDGDGHRGSSSIRVPICPVRYRHDG
jgi:hypothetical protein